MHLRAHRPNFLDQANHPIHLFISRGIYKRAAIAGPVSMDQRCLSFAQTAPKLFGDERHDRVKQNQALVHHPSHGRLGFCARGLILTG